MLFASIVRCYFVTYYNAIGDRSLLFQKEKVALVVNGTWAWDYPQIGFV